MTLYTGNAIYDYINEKGLNYLYMVEHHWLLLYGDSQSNPRLLVLVSKTDDIHSAYSIADKNDANNSYKISQGLKLPFLFVRFDNSEEVAVWDSEKCAWNYMHYDELRNIFEHYHVVQPGTPKKQINQYQSSDYHDWQRHNLGSITVTDLDLVKFDDMQRVSAIFELKRSKKPLSSWTPFPQDYPNFALIINAISNSGNNIEFKLIYNVMLDGKIGERVEDLSCVKIFEFNIPNHQISAEQVTYLQEPQSELSFEIN